MPQFLAAVGASLLAGVGATAAFIAGATTLTIAIGAVAVIGFGYTTARSIRASRARNPGGISEPGNAQQILVRSTNEARKIVYGETVISGPLMLMGVNHDGGANASLHTVVALVGRQINSYLGFYLDDKFIPIADVDTAGDGSVDGNTGSHGYGPVLGTPIVFFRGLLGTAAQTVDTALDSGFTFWTSNHRARGVAYAALRFDNTKAVEEVWSDRGAPSNISVLIRGVLVYDPRLDSTFNGTWGTGSGAHRVATPSTWAYSSNPALCLADYLIDVALGVGIPTAKVDYNDVAIAADACDANVAIPPSTTQDRFTCNGVLSCLDNHGENIEKILSSMAGTLRRYGGQYHIAAGVWPASSSFTLNESHLVGPLTFRAQPERTDRHNSIRGGYFDPARQYKESQYLAVEDTALQTSRDAGQEIWKQLDLPMTNNEYMAQRLAIRSVEQASRTGVLIFPTGYNGLDIAPGDRGTVSIAELGWVSKNFRCIGLQHVDMVGVELTLKEDDSDAYDDPVEGGYGTRTDAAVVTLPTVRRFVGESAALDEFAYASADELHMRWTKRQGGVADGDISLLTGLTDAPGGQAVRFGNNSGNDEWWGALTNVLIPYDPNSTYEVGIIVRRTTGSGLVYCGFEGVGNNRTTMVNTAGSDAYTSQHYVAANGAAPASTWTTYRGYVRGHGTTPTTPANDPNAPSVMRTNTTFIRPMLLVNYNAQAGQMDVAALWVRRSPTVGTPNIANDAVTNPLIADDAVDTTQLADNAATIDYYASDPTAAHSSSAIETNTTEVLTVAVTAPDTSSTVEVTITFELEISGTAWIVDCRAGRSSSPTAFSEVVYRDSAYDDGSKKTHALTFMFSAVSGSQNVSLRSIIYNTLGDPVTATYTGINIVATVVKR